MSVTSVSANTFKVHLATPGGGWLHRSAITWAFFGALEETLARRVHRFFAYPCGLHTLGDRPLAAVADCMAVTAEGFGHVCIRPMGAVGIDLQ